MEETNKIKFALYLKEWDFLVRDDPPGANGGPTTPSPTMGAS